MLSSGISAHVKGKLKNWWRRLVKLLPVERRFFNLLAGISLVLSISTMVVAVRSFWRMTRLEKSNWNARLSLVKAKSIGGPGGRITFGVALRHLDFIELTLPRSVAETETNLPMPSAANLWEPSLPIHGFPVGPAKNS
jgi:hypothetical protein